MELLGVEFIFANMVCRYTSTRFSDLLAGLLKFRVLILERQRLSMSPFTIRPTYLLGWCELEFLLKSPNPQADKGSMIIPEQLLSTKK